MPTTPGVTLSGTLTSVAGIANAGSVKIQLVNYGDQLLPAISGTAVLAPIELTVQAAADGTWSTPLFGNYQISPSGTYYDITVHSATGDFIQNAAYQFNVGGSFALSTLTPLLAVPALSTGLIPVVQNPAGAQSILTFPLNLLGGGTSLTLANTDNTDNIATTAFVQSAIVHVSSGVTTFNGRSGVVVPTTGDYSFSQISGTVSPSQLPDATATTYGVVKAIAQVANQFIQYIDNSGVPHLAQPAYTNLSGLPTLAATLTAVSHKWLASYDATTGLFTQTQPAFTDISGTASTGQIPDLSATYLTLSAATGLYLPLAGGTLTGNLLFSTDNTKDIGASGLTRPRTGYFGTSVVAPTVNATTGFEVNGAAPTGHVLRGDGTNYVDGQVHDFDLVMGVGSTANDYTPSTHGFLPSGPNDASKYFDSTGNWTIPSASSSSSEVINVNQIAHGFAVGQWVYWNGSVWALAVATAVASLAQGVITVVSDADDFTVTIQGYTGVLSGLTGATLYYLSSSVAGTISTTPGTFKQPVLYSLFTGSGFVIPYNGGVIINTQQIGGIQADGNAPAHAGQLLISQTGNTSALWADPFVQGPWVDGTAIVTPGAMGNGTSNIQPILVGGKGADANLHSLSVDNTGKLNVVASGTVAATQSGTWNIATVTAVTAITNALPAGSNVIGHVITDTGSTTAVTGSVTVSGTVAATQSGTWNIATVAAVTAITNPLPAGSNVIGHVIVDSGAVTVAQGTAANLKASVNVNDGSGTAITSTTGALDVNIKSGALSGTINTNVTQFGTNNVVSGGVNGLWTNGNYGTQNTSAASWTSATASNTAVTLLSNVTAYASIVVTLNQAPTGSLSAGAVTFEASNDNSNWYSVQGVNLASTTIVGPVFTLTVGTYSALQFSITAPYFRVRLSTQITGTGTLTLGYSLQTQADINLLVGQFSALLTQTGSAPAAATVGVTSASAVAANSLRKGLLLVNTSGNTISLAFGANAAVLNSGITLSAGGTFSMDAYCFSTAVVNAIASGASSNLSVQEFT